MSFLALRAIIAIRFLEILAKVMKIRSKTVADTFSEPIADKFSLSKNKFKTSLDLFQCLAWS